MASSISVCDLKGKLIISRSYRETDENSIDAFVRRVVNRKPDEVPKPVFCEEKTSFCWLQHHDVYFVAAAERNANAMMLMVFLTQ